jgi:MFS family permease
MAGFMMAVPIGGMLSFAVTGRVAQAVGWRAALAFAALPVVILLPALLLLKEPARERAAQGEPAASPRMLLGIRAFWWIVASGAIVNFVLYSFSTFLPAFLTRVHGFSVADAGMWTGLGSGISGIAGAIAAGMLGDSRLGRQGNRRMALAAAAALAAAPPAFAAVLMPAGRASVAVPLLMLAYGLLQMYYGLVYAAIQDLVAPALRGTAMAVYFMAMYLCGASFGPLLTGGLSDYLAREALRTHQLTMEAARATGLQQAMFTMPALSVVLSAVLWAGARAMATRRPGSAARP